MQKVTRVYVGNYGVDLAWYEGVILYLTDLVTDEPTDTIFNLENGGGKSTLLSFILSCFEPAQDRFLKHVQDSNHRFSQYFMRDGTPGIVLIEWEIPSKGLFGGTHRLVLGQTVSIKSTVDKDDVDRIFFSFEESANTRFDTVPAPKLVAEPVRTMVEFARWIQQAQQDNSTFFHTRVQQDW